MGLLMIIVGLLMIIDDSMNYTINDLCLMA